MTDPSTTRRDFLGDVYTAMAGLGLSALLTREGLAVTGWEPGRGLTHHAAKAKRVLQIFCPGAASHIDLWEHKPELEKRHGSPLPGEENLDLVSGEERQPDEKPLAVRRGGGVRQEDLDALTEACRGMLTTSPFCTGCGRRRTPTAPAVSS